MERREKGRAEWIWPFFGGVESRVAARERDFFPTAYVACTRMYSHLCISFDLSFCLTLSLTLRANLPPVYMPAYVFWPSARGMNLSQICNSTVMLGFWELTNLHDLHLRLEDFLVR